jgi:hypothetical protein
VILFNTFIYKKLAYISVFHAGLMMALRHIFGFLVVIRIVFGGAGTAARMASWYNFGFIVVIRIVFDGGAQCNINDGLKG